DDDASGRVPQALVKEEPVSDDNDDGTESDRESRRRHKSGLRAALNQVRVTQTAVEREVGVGGHFSLDMLADAAAAVESDIANDCPIEIVEISSDSDEGETSAVREPAAESGFHRDERKRLGRVGVFGI